MEEEWLHDTCWVAVDVCDEECGRPRQRNVVLIEDSCARSNVCRIKQLWLSVMKEKEVCSKSFSGRIIQVYSIDIVYVIQTALIKAPMFPQSISLSRC